MTNEKAQGWRNAIETAFQMGGCDAARPLLANARAEGGTLLQVYLRHNTRAGYLVALEDSVVQSVRAELRDSPKAERFALVRAVEQATRGHLRGITVDANGDGFVEVSGRIEDDKKTPYTAEFRIRVPV